MPKPQEERMKLFGEELHLLISDLDGVLVDIETHFARNLEEAAREVGLPPERIRPYLACRGDKSGVWKSNREGGFAAMWPEATAGMFRKFDEACFRIESAQGYVECPGATNTIRWLWRKRVMVTLCTTSSRQSLLAKLEAIGFSLNTFASPVYGVDKSTRNSRILHRICNNFRTIPKHVAYIGDWENDWELAHGAGIRFLAVSGPVMTREKFLDLGVPEDHILPSFRRLQHLIKPSFP
jgi:phosphoglycolate phosphatase-like HAD superfamily hydrolase